VLKQVACTNKHVLKQAACTNKHVLKQAACTNKYVLKQAVCTNKHVLKQAVCTNKHVLKQAACTNKHVLKQAAGKCAPRTKHDIPTKWAGLARTKDSFGCTSQCVPCALCSTSLYKSDFYMTYEKHMPVPRSNPKSSAFPKAWACHETRTCFLLTKHRAR
jgi:hypothetical protein